MPNRDLKVTLVGDDQTGGAFRSASGNAEGFGSKIGAVGKGMALAFGGAVVGGVVGLGAALVQGAKDAASYQKVTDQVAQTIKSTGGAAGVSVSGLKDYAGQLESMSGVDEEAILSGQNVLLTFTNIQNKVGAGNDIFNQASLAASNMSATLGTDLVSANTMLGKALNDPIKGITALSRAGVTFTAAQKEQITALTKSGDVMGAQKIILGELNKEFGGAAEAAGKGLTGSLARAKDAFDDMFRNLATALLPKLADLAQMFATKVVPTMINIANVVIPAVVRAFHTVVDVVSSAVAWFKQHQTTIEIVAAVIGGLLLPHLIRLGIESTITAAKSVAGWVAQQVAAVTSSAVSVASTYRMIAAWVAARVAAVASFTQTIAIMALYAAESVANGARAAAAWVVAQARTVASLVATAAGFVAQGAVMVASWVATAASVVAGWVLMGVQSLIQAARMAAAWLIAMGPVGWVIAAVVALVALIIANWDTVVKWTTTAWNAVTGAISAAWNWITGIVSGAITAVRVVISGVWNWITSATSNAWNAVVGAVSAGVNNVISFVQSIPGRVMSAIGNLGSLLLNAGRDLLTGLWNGISGAASWLWGKVKSFFGSLLPGWVKDMLGIASPSKVFAELGKFTMLGFGAGIDSGTGSAVSAAQRAAMAITGAMSVQPAIPGMSALALSRPIGGSSGTSAGMGGASGTTGSGGSVVHIENYNEAQQPVHEVAQELAFLARSR